MTHKPQIDEVYAELDRLRRQAMSKKNGKGSRNRPLTKRVFLGTKTDPDQTPWLQIYPCMLDTAWYKDYLGGKQDKKIFMYVKDPDGWQEDAVEEEINAEDAED
jgi:hypothetical protein